MTQNIDSGSVSWMTPGQALDWMMSHPGEYLMDDKCGTFWRWIDQTRDLEFHLPGLSRITNDALGHLTGGKYRIPSAALLAAAAQDDGE